LGFFLGFSGVLQNIDINANQTYQNEGKDTIAQANLAITANTVNNQGGQLAAGGNLNIAVDTLDFLHKLIPLGFFLGF
jgi:adhesin HecA-like repeat protein